MKRLILLAAIAFGFQIGAAEALDPLMGVYEGFWKTPDGKQGRVTAQVRPIGKGNYDGFVAVYKAGTLESAMKITSTAPGKFQGTSLKQASGGALTANVDGDCEIANGKLTGKIKGDLGDGILEANLKKVRPPSLGAKPPANGIVIFDGKPNDKWADLKWKITPEGSLVVGAGDIETKDKYANYLLHLEFKTPFMPEATGQGRGNSGVYLQNKYEVQVLDSFGLYPLRDNDCAGIYGVVAADMNACLPPGEWQTYDITFVQRTADEKTTVTVVLNGETVIEKRVIPNAIAEKGTGGAKMTGGFLRLQDHGNPVEYRNIWVEPFFVAERK